MHRCVDGQIEMEPLEHTAMEEELNKPEYGEYSRAQAVMYILRVTHSVLVSVFRIRIHFIRIQHFRLNTDPDPDPGF